MYNCEFNPPAAVKNNRYVCDDHLCAPGDYGADNAPPPASPQQRIAVGRQQEHVAEAPKPAVAPPAGPETETVTEIVPAETLPPPVVTRLVVVTEMVTVETTQWFTAAPTPMPVLRRRDGHQHRKRHAHGH